MLQQWLDNGMKESPYEIGLIISKLIVMGPAYTAGLRRA
ncbi:TetR-like C-terminal domain-containing protein [Halalkalibacterium halodurans]|nr:TetR-like C-terminal domain-containing protein [Halalkalibacterium halodurans]MDY7222509.1 TetR-like C-terminal domain-containing protein [Halalkalibacterium halodurans]MDY7241730.1 TetR-like C-terminal domain-containing protein [Halalkalibacterium halodurans]MED4082640.1 TetR-like C-terminal domain-containing protein [Halalkalibacterium halodurans]MED4085906.1 TetR-like C-terminal domain-containing protein [Halalkalibacterium halodurans]MED4104000.1 TetR-like C-terminal domain-containing p